MWIAKGVLLGIVLFVVGGISCVGIRIGFDFYRLIQRLKAGTARHAGGVMYESRGQLFHVLHNPLFWVGFLAAIAVGLWIIAVLSHVPVVFAEPLRFCTWSRCADLEKWGR